MRHDTETNGPLAGLKVVDCSTVLAGPISAMVLADFGADVVKIEHPTGDALRKMGHAKDGHGVWWKVTNRNKRTITLDLHDQDGKAAFLALVKDADVLVENFRTGTLEKWGLGWDVLTKLNPRLVMLRVTGFGQTGPYRFRPGYGTVAEAFSGFAHITGEPKGPPTLPPFGLADGVAAYHGVFAIMFAIYERDVQGSGKGQFIDLALYEPLFSCLGAQVSTYDQLGLIQERRGNRSDNNVPRRRSSLCDQCRAREARRRSGRDGRGLDWGAYTDRSARCLREGRSCDRPRLRRGPDPPGSAVSGARERDDG
jgi:crotonobetainyl-CoA:carnitine CoA-transferase CaiB-like acyl-CoA transferase